MNYRQALEYIVRRRRSELQDAEALYMDALRQNTALYETERRLRALKLDEVFLEKSNAAEIDKCELDKRGILENMGITAAMLAPPPHCALCGDTGINGNNFCDCVKRLSIKDNENIELPLNRFSESDDSFLDDELRSLYRTMTEFCAKFPDTNAKNIILLGSTGKGKTHLASCMTSEILEKGNSAMFITAFGFLTRALKCHTAPEREKYDYLRPFLDCDFLIIDDLGTESMLKNVTVEYMYIIINERLLKDKHTLITSNLSMDDLANRYGEKLVSRLFDRRKCFAKVLLGKDLRKL